MRAQIRQQPVRRSVQQILVDQHRHPYRDAQDALRDQPCRRRRRAQPRRSLALATAPLALALDHPSVGAHLDLHLLGVLTAMRVILVPACRAAAPLRVNLVCFHLHRQVCMLAPAMALSPALPALPTFARSTVPHGAGGRHGAPTTATKRCPPIRWPSPPTLPSAPSGALPILRRMMASAASCRNDCSHYRRAVRVARGPVNPRAPLPQGAGTVPSSPRSALRPVAGRASVAARVGRYAGGPPTGTGAGASRSMAPVRGRRISALSGGAPSQSNSNLWRVSEMI